MSEEAQFDPSVSDASAPTGTARHERALHSVQLAGFSLRDREIMRLFLRRPPGTGIRLDIVDASRASPTEGEEIIDVNADLLIGNATTPEVLALLRARGAKASSIGIVERFERDAPFYQVAQDGQLLFSLAQAINRIRGGWVPPGWVNGETTEAQKSPDVAVGLSVAPQLEAQSEQSLAIASSPPPVAAATAASAMAASVGLPWQRALDILVVDDSHFSREAISAALVKVGFSVDTAASGADGIRMATNKHFDVALVDFEMPEMLGTEVLRKLRALGAQSPSVLIMLTSRTGAVDRLRAKFAGCDAYLTKPTQMKEFLATLRNLAIAGKLSRQ
jgi:CheY-like chemotaxis protein